MTTIAERAHAQRISPTAYLELREYVIGRLAEAAERLRLIPLTSRDLPSGYKCSMPDVVRDYWEAYGYDKEAPARCGVPSAAEIDSMWEAIGWLSLVKGEFARRVVWLRSAGLSWPRIAKICRCSRRTTIDRFLDGIDDILAVVMRNAMTS